MFLSAKNSKVAAAVVTLIFSGAALLHYKTTSDLKNVEESYLKLLRQQTARFASRRTEKLRTDFVETHQSVFRRLSRYQEIKPARKVVLAQLADVAKNGLKNVSYEFLAPQEQHDVVARRRLITDGLRVQGVTAHMVDFNRVMQKLHDREPGFYELFHCDIQRVLSPESELKFDCSLRWKLLLRLNA